MNKLLPIQSISFCLNIMYCKLFNKKNPYISMSYFTYSKYLLLIKDNIEARCWQVLFFFKRQKYPIGYKFIENGYEHEVINYVKILEKPYVVKGDNRCQFMKLK